MGNGIFVTGTDTGVGKTLVSSALVRRLVQTGRSVGVMKPVETGVLPEQLSESDAGRLMAAAGVSDGIDEVSPYRFPAPLAPFAAASAQGSVIEMQEIMRRYERLAARDSCVVVEGAGGLLVPMGKDWDMRDLIGRIGLPVVLVGRAGLGGINHALLTSLCGDGCRVERDGVVHHPRAAGAVCVYGRAVAGASRCSGVGSAALSATTWR